MQAIPSHVFSSGAENSETKLRGYIQTGIPSILDGIKINENHNAANCVSEKYLLGEIFAKQFAHKKIEDHLVSSEIGKFFQEYKFEKEQFRPEELKLMKEHLVTIYKQYRSCNRRGSFV